MHYLVVDDRPRDDTRVLIEPRLNRILQFDPSAKIKYDKEYYVKILDNALVESIDRLGNSGSYFYGSSNLVLTATDHPSDHMPLFITLAPSFATLRIEIADDCLALLSGCAKVF